MSKKFLNKTILKLVNGIDNEQLMEAVRESLERWHSLTFEERRAELQKAGIFKLPRKY